MQLPVTFDQLACELVTDVPIRIISEEAKVPELDATTNHLYQMLLKIRRWGGWMSGKLSSVSEYELLAEASRVCRVAWDSRMNYLAGLIGRPREFARFSSEQKRCLLLTATREKVPGYSATNLSNSIQAEFESCNWRFFSSLARFMKSPVDSLSISSKQTRFLTEFWVVDRIDLPLCLLSGSEQAELFGFRPIRGKDALPLLNPTKECWREIARPLELARLRFFGKAMVLRRAESKRFRAFLKSEAV